MTTWVNPLDKVPQIPQDWANHLLYGAMLGAICAAAYCLLLHASLAHGWICGTAVAFVVTAGKKIVDYFMEMESISMCVGKTFVTALLPFCFYLNSVIYR